MTVGVFRFQLARVHLHEHWSGYIADRWSSQIDSRRGGGVHGGRYDGGCLVERRVMHPGVVPGALRLSQQEALFSRFPRGKEGLTSEALAVSQGLREGLVLCLGQQKNADDADEGAARKDDVVKEIALLIVELHDGGCQHAETSAGQDQTQTTTPDHSGCDLSTEEDAQVADCVGGKHADDGEGDGELLIQRT